MPRCICPNHNCSGFGYSSSFSMEQHPGAQEIKLKILKSHKKSAISSSKGHCTLLHCCTAVLCWGQDGTVYIGKSWSFRPVALLRHVPTAEGSLLAGLYCSLVCFFWWSRAAVCAKQQSGSSRLIQLPVHVSRHPGISLRSLSSLSACLWLLPGPYTPAVPLSGEVMSPPTTLPDKRQI